MSSVFSDHWHLVAELKPRLKQNATLHRHLYRDEVWYLLRDETSGQFHRFTNDTYQIIGLLDGRYTLNQIWELACEKLGDAMPTQDEIIELLQKLYRANALNSDTSVNIERFTKVQESQLTQKTLKKMATPFGVKIPLFQPQEALEKYQIFEKVFFNTKFLIVMLISWLMGINLTLTHWEALTNNLSDRLLAPDALILMAVIYPIIKIIHEFAHAFAVTKFGGKVHEMGVMLLVFFPVPYVDASSANGFSSKYKRMLVAASGILAELTLASLALVVWSFAEEGALKAIAFYVAITAGVSSLFFNGNPLLKFDAYFVLTDVLELPNLATRSNQYLGYLFKKYLLYLPNQISNVTRNDEAWIFTVYGVLAFVYRIFVFIAIGFFVAQSYWFIGVLMIIWAGSVTLLLPAYKSWQKLLSTKEVKLYPVRFWTRFLMLIAFLVSLLIWIPMPYTTHIEGTIPAQKSFSIKASGEGRLEVLNVANGSYVMQGQAIASLDSELLNLEVDKIKAQIAEIKAKSMAVSRDAMKLKWLKEEQNILESALHERMKLLKEKTIYADRSGIWMSSQSQLGAYIKRGEVLGYINPQLPSDIIAMIPERDVSLIKEGDAFTLRMASQPLVSYSGTLLSISPKSDNEVISPILTKQGGGKVVLDETGQAQALENYFKMKLKVDDEAVFRHLEERFYVVIEHQPEPIVYRLARYIRQNFLESFSV